MHSDPLMEPDDRLPDLARHGAAKAPLVSVDQVDRGGESMSANEELVASGLAILRKPLSLFVCQSIANQYGDSWWTEGVLETLTYAKYPTIEDVRRHRRLPESGTVEECAETMDISVCLILLTKQWARIFSSELSPDHRGWAFEIIGVRNTNKHLGGVDHPSDYAWRALDSMIRLCEPIDAGAAEELLALRSSVDLTAYGQVVVDSPNIAVSTTAASGAQVAQDTAESTPDSALGKDDASSSEEMLEEMALVGPDFSGADLRKMDFSGANLAGADFTDANLLDANFKGAVLTRAVFRNASLGNVDLTDADLSGALFEGTSLSVTRQEGEYSSSPFITRGADLTGATLDGATLNFAGTDLRGVNFKGLNLDGADFTDANLADANLTGASLRGARLKGANIKDAIAGDVQWT